MVLFHAFVLVLLYMSQGKDRSIRYIERYCFEIDRPPDFTASFEAIVRPEVIPVTTRKIDGTSSCSLFRYGSHQNTAAPQILIVARNCNLIVGIVQPERAHHGHACCGAFADGAVQV